MERVTQIEDPADPRIEAYLNVRERDLVGRERRFVAEGEVVLRMLVSSSRLAIESVFILANRLPRLAPLLATLPDAVPVYAAPRQVMDRVVGFPIHRGVLAIGHRGPERPASEILMSSKATGLVVGVIGISNHDNVGGIFRNAAAFGADAILLDASSCDPLYRKAIRVSAGASLTVPFARARTAEELVHELSAAAYSIVALSPSGGETLDEIALGPRTALLFGEEGKGLPPSILACTSAVRIPMTAGFDSLNVATASGIALYEVWRRHDEAAGFEQNP